MSRLLNAYTWIKEFSTRYPAILSGCIIYCYLSVAIIRFYVKATGGPLTFYDIYETFDALPFMWLLSSALVRIIDIRTKLHDAERARILEHRELELKETQVQTMNEVAKGFQHRINNPLAIIYVAVNRLKRSAGGSKEVQDKITLIEESMTSIAQAVTDFSEAQKYTVERVESVVGTFASPASLKPPS